MSRFTTADEAETVTAHEVININSARMVLRSNTHVYNK